MLKRALPPFVLVLAACNSPEPEPPPRAEAPAARVAERPAGVVDRKPAPPAVAAKPPAQVEPTHSGIAPVAVDEATRALFLANCAQCHGEKGDGEGVTQLDRKARSFLEGGFSYGNTKDAILRSITHGIPGTPMPAFEKALNEAQRADLARYVIAFGPDQIVVDPSESEMVVKDRPLVVRGKLPPIVEGATEWARGLAIGTTDGMTFEYRTDDVRLVGVRAGRFVNRSDWGERGGTALEMLGRALWNPAAAPDAMRVLLATSDAGIVGQAQPAVARLVATSAASDAAWVEYALGTSDAAAPRVVVRERCESFRNELGSGFVQRRMFRTTERGTYVGVLDLAQGIPHAEAGSCVCALVAGEHPTLLVASARTPSRSATRSAGARLLVELTSGQEQEIDVYVLTDLAPGTAWTGAFQERIVREFCR